MLLRNLGVEGEIELAHPPPVPPLPELRSERIALLLWLRHRLPRRFAVGIDRSITSALIDAATRIDTCRAPRNQGARPMLRTTPSSILLRAALLADALASGATGVLLAVAAGPLAPLLGLPETLLFRAGIALMPFAALVAWAGATSHPPRGVVNAIAVVNYAWVAASIGLLIAPPTPPTLPGYAFVLVQALAVLLLTATQTIAASRRGRPAAQSSPVESGWRRSS